MTSLYGLYISLHKIKKEHPRPSMWVFQTENITGYYPVLNQDLIDAGKFYYIKLNDDKNYHIIDHKDIHSPSDFQGVLFISNNYVEIPNDLDLIDSARRVLPRVLYDYSKILQNETYRVSYQLINKNGERLLFDEEDFYGANEPDEFIDKSIKLSLDKLSLDLYCTTYIPFNDVISLNGKIDNLPEDILPVFINDWDDNGNGVRDDLKSYYTQHPDDIKEIKLRQYLSDNSNGHEWIMTEDDSGRNVIDFEAFYEDNGDYTGIQCKNCNRYYITDQLHVGYYIEPCKKVGDLGGQRQLIKEFNTSYDDKLIVKALLAVINSRDSVSLMYQNFQQYVAETCQVYVDDEIYWVFAVIDTLINNKIVHLEYWLNGDEEAATALTIEKIAELINNPEKFNHK